MFDIQQDVFEAHRRHDIPINMVPTAPDPETAVRYEQAISEQAIDLTKGLRSGDILKIAECGSNLLYVTLSMLTAAGVDVWPFLATISQENIERGVAGEKIAPHVWIASAAHQMLTGPQLLKKQQRIPTERVYKTHEGAAEWLVEEAKTGSATSVRGMVVVAESRRILNYGFTALMDAALKAKVEYRGDSVNQRARILGWEIHFREVGDPHRLAGQEYQRAWLMARYMWSRQNEQEYIDRLLANFREPNCKVVESIG